MQLNINGKDYVDVDFETILNLVMEELEETDSYVEGVLDTHHYLSKKYTSKVLNVNVKDDWDPYAVNDVEGLNENTKYYEYMQLYSTYPVYDLYHLNWKEFIDQPEADVEFQLKMAKKLYQTQKSAVDSLENENKVVQLDENTRIDLTTNKIVREQPKFKRNF